MFGAIIGTVGERSAYFMHQVEVIAITMVVLAVIVLVVSTIWFYLFSRVAASLSQRIQRTYLAAVLSKDIAWFDVRTPAEIPTRLSADIEKIQAAVASKAGNFVMNVSQAVSGLALGFAKGWIIALVCCGCIPIIIITRLMLANSMKRSSTASQALYAKAGAVAEEVLMSIRTVAAFGGENRESKRYDKLLGEGKDEGVKVAISVAFTTALVLSCMFAIYALALYVGGLLVDHGVINTTTGQVYQGSDIYVVLTSVIMSAFALGSMSPSLHAFTEGTAALEGLSQTIAESTAIEPSMLEENGRQVLIAKPKAAFLDSSSISEKLNIGKIEFKDVSFRYPSRPDVMTLQSLSLTIQAGQKVALVGESGSGKSTIISMLERFYDPLSGSVSINGRDIKTLNPHALRSMFGYVGQEPVMFASSIRDNLTYGLPESSIPLDTEIKKALRRANVLEFVMSLPDQLDTYCGPGGSQMSGGQKQRIAIARALLRDPQVLLLDEATSALDNESEKMVQRTLDSLQESSADSGTNLTTISVAHRLSTVRNSDVIFVLKRGGILVEQGTHLDLMALNGYYTALVASQAATAVAESPRHSSTDLGAPGTSVLQTASGADEEDSKRKSNTGPNKSEEEKEKERISEIAKTYRVPWRRLLAFTKGHSRWLYISGCVGAAGKGSSFPLHALLFSSVVSWYYLNDKAEMMHKISIASFYYVGLSVGVFIAVFVDFWSFAHIGGEFTMRIRSDCFRHLLSQDMGFFDEPDNAPAKLLMSLSSWAAKMHVLAGEVVGVFVEFLAALVAGLTIAFVASAKLTGILIGTLPLLMLAMVMTSRFLWSAGKREDIGSRQAALVASEAVQNMRTVRALTGEVGTLNLYEMYSERRVMEETKKSLRSSIVFGVSMMVAFLPYALGFYVGGLYVDDGSLSLQDMTQVLLGLILTSVGAGQALAFLPDIKAAKTAAHDIFSLLDRVSKVNPFLTSYNTQKDDVVGDGSIVFDNVQFAYPQRPETPILKGLSFRVEQGLKVALVGPSGSGKSSIIALLQRFYDPVSGAIRLGGRDLREMDVAALRAVMGYVGQEPVLFDTTMETNVKYGNVDATDEQLEQVQVQAKLDFISGDNVQWSTNLGPKGGLLSGGQKQRTAIARALLRDPKLLLLDEATSALDSASEKIVQKAIDAATVGRTTFVIAHRLSTIRDADLILVIVSGQLVEQGTHDELMDRGGVYHQLYLKGTQ